MGYARILICRRLVTYFLKEINLDSSVQFSHSVVSDSLQPHESQHARPPCPSPTPRVHSDSRPSSWWCHPAISSSVVPLLLLPPIPPSIRVFSNESTLCMRWPKYWSFSFSIIPSKEIFRFLLHLNVKMNSRSIRLDVNFNKENHENWKKVEIYLISSGERN